VKKEDKMSESIHTMTDQIVVFTLDELLYALPLPAVVKVIHAIEIRHLPKAPEIIAGIINIKGQIIPVADIRKRFGLAAHETDPDDRLIIADTGKRQVAILVDSVTGIRDLTPRQMIGAQERLPFAEHLKGVAKVDDELILIYDLEQFLSLEEEKVLEQALKTKNK
jgi:purine-binding chemotaxis protein CheW